MVIIYTIQTPIKFQERRPPRSIGTRDAGAVLQTDKSIRRDVGRI